VTSSRYNMMVHQNERLRSLLLILLLCTLNTVESDKLDSRRRRLPTRRTGLRQPLDEYGNPIPLRDSRDFPADQRSFLTDERSYPIDDDRIFQQREYEEYEGEEEQEPVTTVPDDLVLQYTSKLPSAIMVSVCSGA
jgi:hypothetical protein